ncbi:RsfA family transcriptional regulator [Kyrpidia spormannii]|uniref:RsfA family transcriptional regulator n=1 Tax=Kyrpidia spormannii TaxID=2055160 RepID=A0A2K8N9E0_9BACL|nr:RsfA family transcriptional regulator [Kyrpidia spormannii]ATY85715.1 RsfA family transcriptional regulator [Kyrpidia spormannii]
METVERWTTRSDAWAPEDDKKLADIVLRHIREGSTQLSAFVEAASELGRTPAACGYRWNGIIRKNYEEAIQEAKRMKKERLAQTRGRRGRRRQVGHQWNIDAVIQSLRAWEEVFQKMEQENAELRRTVTHLEDKVRSLEQENRQLREGGALSQAEQLRHDSREFLALVDRARKLFQEIGEKQPPLGVKAQE